MEDGRVVAGETAVASDRHGVRRLFLDPRDATANPHALAAIEGADLIVLGPGSLFTSTLPPLLVPALRRAILSAHAPRVYVCNLLQQPGETIGYRASHHLERLHQHVGPGVGRHRPRPVGAGRRRRPDPRRVRRGTAARARREGRAPADRGRPSSRPGRARARARRAGAAGGRRELRRGRTGRDGRDAAGRAALPAGPARRRPARRGPPPPARARRAARRLRPRIGRRRAPSRLAAARERCELRDPHLPRAPLRPAGPLPGDRRIGPALAAGAGGGRRARRVARHPPNASRAGSSRARAADAPTCAAPSSRRDR